MSNVERSGFRDAGISQWHRKLGNNCCATDLDAMITLTDVIIPEDLTMLEYDNNEPVALIDYKLRDFGGIKFDASSLKAQASLATKAGIPSLVVKYTSDRTKFTVYPTNDIARRKVPNGITLDEVDFARFLYFLRGKQCPADVIQKLEDNK